MEKMKKTTDGASKMDCGKQETETLTAKLTGIAGTSEKSMANQNEQAPADTKCLMQIILVPIREVEPHPLVKDFYPIEPNMLAAMTESMKEHGYDPRFPVQATRTGNRYLVWDGLTRRRAALDAGIKIIPVMISEFDSDDALMEAVITAQNRRRSCTTQVLILSVERLTAIASRKAKASQGKRNDLVTSGQICPEVESGGANEYIAKMIGRSATTVKHIKELIDNPELRRKVVNGELSPHQAHEMLHPKKKPSLEKALSFAAGLTQAGKSSDDDRQDAVVPSSGKSEVKKDSADGVTPGVTNKAAKEAESKAQDIPVPLPLLRVLVHYYPAAHIKELEEQFESCDPELLKFISSMLSGSKAA